MQAVSLGLAVAAAGCNAVSSVLQRKANRRSEKDPFGVPMLIRVVHQPAWLLGGLSMLASFLLQAAALGSGTLSSVEPVLVLELPLTLVLGSVLLHHHLHKRDWLGIITMSLGLAMFVGVLAPRGGEAAQVSTALSVIATAGTAVGIAALALAASRGPERSRAALFGVAAGSGFGLTASLIKVAVSRLNAGGVASLFGSWETYALAVCGVASVVLVQAALHAGTLVAAQPGITLFDPIVSLLWGIVVLGERTRTGPVLLVAVLGALLIGAAVVGLAHASQRAQEQ